MSAPVVFVPLDSAARSVGADEVADAIGGEAAARGHEVQLVRNGSRGMFWLEPLVEVATKAGRVAYGPVGAGDVGVTSDFELAAIVVLEQGEDTSADYMIAEIRGDVAEAQGTIGIAVVGMGLN